MSRQVSLHCIVLKSFFAFLIHRNPGIERTKMIFPGGLFSYDQKDFSC